MSTILIASEAETEAFAARLAGALRPGDVVALVGDLGAGKTRIVQGLAHALGIPIEDVTSPTFTLIHEYAGRIPLRHCDAYRLRRPEEFADLGLDELFAEDGIAVVEWADRVEQYLPRDHLRVQIEAVGPTARTIELTAAGPRSQALLARW
jgi:tRNA threonylcarbamoyladenosine biosynthesis protein TsaE